MSGHGFASALAGDLDAYLAFKTDMGGRDTAARACYLRKFEPPSNQAHTPSIFM